MTRLATPVRNAAYMLFDRGYNIDEVKSILDDMTKPTEGYVYLDEMPADKNVRLA